MSLHRRLATPLLAVGATAVAAAAAEGIVRALGKAPEVKAIWLSSQESVYRRSTNPLLAYELKPGYRNPDADLVQTYERTNAHGLRDRERTLEKPDGARRILLLGDSVVEGVGVRQEAVMSRRLEGLLADGTEVLSFGVSGYCTLAEVELLAVKGLAFQPDVVILLFVENDFLNFNREGFALGGLERPGWQKRLFLASHLFRWTALELDLFDFAIDADPVPVNRRALGENNVVEGLRRLRRLADEHRFRPIVAIWPVFLDDGIVDTQTMPDDPAALVVERLAAMVGLSTVRLSPYFRHAARRLPPEANPRLVFTVGDELHPSEVGHEVAALALRSILEDLATGRLPTPQGAADPAAVAAAAALGASEAPTYALVLTRLGNDALAAGEPARAEGYYRQALAEEPDHADAHNGLGVLLLDRGELEGAIAHFRRAVAAAPRFVEAHLNLGGALERGGRRAEAGESYRRVLALRPDLTAVRERLAAVAGGEE